MVVEVSVGEELWVVEEVTVDWVPVWVWVWVGLEVAEGVAEEVVVPPPIHPAATTLNIVKSTTNAAMPFFILLTSTSEFLNHSLKFCYKKI
ncbi:hypothetical protein JCM16138_05930 [Thermococcus atlanticus]